MTVRVLLVDDNPDQVAITRRVLKGAGDYLVDSALDALEGLEKLSTHPFDVVLCDYRLPSMSGLDVLKRLREQGQEVPFILVTGLGNERVAVEAMQGGASDYVVKDVYDDMLPGIVRRAIERHQERQERRRLEAERDTAQAALQASYEQLKRLLEFKDDLIAKVSHEFRTPLTSVKQGVSLLLDQALGPISVEQREYLTVIERDIDRLTELVNNILDLSKTEAGQMQLQRRQIDMGQLIEMTMQSFRPLRGNRTLVAEGLPHAFVFVDPHRVLQVLSNFLSNAIKFTPDDGIITFRVEQRDQHLAVAVTDSGRGISEHDLPKLFQKFSQVGTRDPNQPRGTGLGLVVCKELVELHRGRVEVTSQLGRGTTFTTLLPLHGPTVMLTESFRELQVLAVFEQQQTVALIAINAAGSSGSTEAQPDLYQFMEEVRRSVHRNDIVLALEPAWIVVLAVTEPDGAQAIVRRLRSALKSPQRPRFGIAVYPTDGIDAASLLEHARAALEQDLNRM